ncbi:MAG TPA: S8 family serine peptidase [Candidatus Eisenbacteria bacterium]|nr:S8 family serine peptidase [Candidatus Eisenbacteria bacterium]
MRRVRITGLVVTFIAMMVTFAWGSLPKGPGSAPGLIAPEPDATAYEGGLRFAWVAAPGTARQVLAVSTKPFDARTWTAVEKSSELTVIEAKRPNVALSELGLTIDRDQPLYWAVGTARTTAGALQFSETRTLNVLRKFRNRVEPSPFLVASPIGKASPQVVSAPERIRLAAGYTIDPAAGEPVLPGDLSITGGPTVGSRSSLLHYGDADPARVREAVLAAGGRVIAYIPDHTFLVRFESGQIPLIDGVRWSGVYQPAYKLSPDLDLQAGTVRPVSVLAFPDADMTALRTAIEGVGARVLKESNNGINKILRIDASGLGLAAVAQIADVAWVEPYIQPTVDNANAQWIVQTSVTNNRHIWDVGIGGQGQIIHHSDSGIDVTHELFSDASVAIPTYGDYPTHRKIIRYEKGSDDPNIAFGDHPGATYHGSHTSGTTAGNDLTAPISGFDGIAHFAKLWHSDLGGPVLGTGIAAPPDLNDLFQPSYTGNAGGSAKISTNSWGAPVGGAYNLNSSAVDQFMYNHPDYLVCFASGNSGGANTVGAPGTAKNIVTVGGTLNGTLASARTIYSSTSRGPTDDGRRKPTICSPASGLTSARAGPANYGSLSGTSMATPNTAATCALLRQYCTEGWYPTGAKIPANGFAPSAALLKAMLVNSALNDVTGFTAPDNNIGYGRICADSVLFFTGDEKRLLLVDQTEGLGHGEMIEYQVNVSSITTSLEVTLCWTDFPASPSSLIQLVNNLNLTVTNGTDTYKGNVYSGGASVTGGVYDDRNVEEAVLVKFPTAGVWTIRVEGFNVPVGPQGFGLAVTGGVGTSAGSVAMDRASYGSSGSVEVQVADTDAGGSVSVTMASTSEPAGETLVIPGGNGLYTGSIPLSPFAGTAGDGTLRVSHGDVITATYNDGSPVATVVANATVSFNPPVITGVSATVGGAGATVTWITNKNATSQVYYGTTPALGSSSPFDAAALFSHSVTLAGLTPGQNYYFDVESEDLIGNLTRDDNGGSHYTFTAPPSGDLLLVYGGDAFERPTYYTSALTELGWTYEIWSGSQSETPALGNLTSGMRSYKAIWWQPSLELYPPVSPSAQSAITQYLDGGGRLAMTGHDIVWALADPTSPYYSVPAQQWVLNTLRTIYNSDPAGWTSVAGIAADPISGPYTGGLPYAEHRSGASGDEVDPSGGAVASWRSGDGSPDDAGIRWDSGGPLGTPGSGVWGGAPSRLATMYYEWSGVDFANAPSSATRRELMRRTLAWLLGRDKPAVTVTAPNGGEVITTNSTNITWSELTDGGTGVGSRTIEYSTNGGTSWVTITAAAGPSPYNWDLTAVPNSPSVVVRVTVFDDGSPSLKGIDASNAPFSIQRVGGDLAGPVVVAGSIVSSPNPILIGSAATLTATVSDSTTGSSNISAAEWSIGASPAAAGAGTAMSGTFTSPKVAVSASLPTGSFTPGTRKLWVRGQDAIGNWGNASALQLVVNGTGVVGIGDGQPVPLELRQNVPNPVNDGTAIVFGLPAQTTTRLSIYDVTGRRVRDLVNGSMPAGLHTVRWDRTDESGRSVTSGVFYYRMVAAGKTLVRRLVVLN